MVESLIVYSGGRGIYRRDEEEIRGEVDENTLSALETVLDLISRRGFSEVGPRPSAMDYLHHEVIYPKRGERFAWVDDWASEIELPGEIRALTRLLEYIISRVRGEAWANREESSTTYLRMRASLNKLVAENGETLLLKVSLACAGDVEIFYVPSGPDSPDVEVRSTADISIEFLRVEGRTVDASGRRKLVPGRELGIEASVVLKGVNRGLHWLSVHFPPKMPNIEVSLPLVIV